MRENARANSIKNAILFSQGRFQGNFPTIQHRSHAPVFRIARTQEGRVGELKACVLNDLYFLNFSKSRY